MKYILLVLMLIYSFNCQANWMELAYDSNSECFATGIKRVFIPFPGFGTWACAKDTIKQLPDYEKSVYLLAGHATGLCIAGCTTFALLVIGFNLKMPGCESLLGSECASYLKIKFPKNNGCK